MTRRHRSTPCLVVLCLAAALSACATDSTGTRRPTSPENLPIDSAPATGTDDAARSTAGVVTMGPLPPVTQVDAAVPLPVGQPPRVPYVDGTTIVLPGGRQVVLERPPKLSAEDIAGESYGPVARVPAGWISTTYDFMQDVSTFHSPDGSFRRRPSGSRPVSVSPDGRRVLMWDTGQTVLLDSGSQDITEDVLTIPGVSAARLEPVGLVGRRGRQVVLNLMNMRSMTAAGVVVTDGRDVVEVPGVARAASVSARAGIISGTHHRGTRARASTVYSLDGEPLFQAPGFEVVGFSPDGTLALGVPHRWNPRRIVVVSIATGKVLLHLELRGSLTWEDDRHLLVAMSRVTRTTLRQGLLRLSLDGAAVWAVPMRSRPQLSGRPNYGPHPVLQPD